MLFTYGLLYMSNWLELEAPPSLSTLSHPTLEHLLSTSSHLQWWRMAGRDAFMELSVVYTFGADLKESCSIP
jgi:hypothetical protein